MRRASWVALLGVLLWVWLGLARMRDDVAEELHGARALAVLTERLAALGQMPDDQALKALRDWRGEGPLRHLSLSLVDEQGRPRFSAGPVERLTGTQQVLVALDNALFEPAAPFTVAWPLPRPEGRTWVVTLTSAPESERAEALAALLQGALLVGLVAVGMVLIMAWNTRQAFAPLGRLLSAIDGLGAPGPGPSAVSRLPPMPVAELETVAAALRHLDEALSQATQQRRHLAQQMLNLQEDERQRLAAELHDEFGQRLTALRVQTAWLARRVNADEEVATVLREMNAQCEQVQRDVRGVLARLRPLPPGEAGAMSLAQLGELLGSLVAAWARAPAGGPRPTLRLRWQDAAGGEQDWVTQAPGWALPESAVLALYRISQEALTNVARHAGASQAQLQLDVRACADGQQLQIDWQVSDDGVGLPQVDAALAQGSGLAGIKQRLWVLGSDLSCEPTRLDAGAPVGCRLRAAWTQLATRVSGASETDDD